MASDDLVAFVRRMLDDDEQKARRACEYASPEWHLDDEHGETVLWWPPEPRVAEMERRKGLPVVSDRWRGQTVGSGGGRIAPHIARHDPARVLREVAAKRALLDDLLASRHDVVEDCWYTCAAATEEHDGGETCDASRRGGPCDCGRDARIQRYARLLAAPYREHPDYPPDA